VAALVAAIANALQTWQADTGQCTSKLGRHKGGHYQRHCFKKSNVEVCATRLPKAPGR